MAKPIASRTKCTVRRYDSVAYNAYTWLAGHATCMDMYPEQEVDHQVGLFKMALLFFPFLPGEAIYTISAYEEEVSK